MVEKVKEDNENCENHKKTHDENCRFQNSVDMNSEETEGNHL